jgi:hypothetical protein
MEGVMIKALSKWLDQILYLFSYSIGCGGNSVGTTYDSDSGPDFRTLNNGSLGVIISKKYELTPTTTSDIRFNPLVFD